MIIDCHNHVNWSGGDADALVRHIDKIGVDKMWILSWENRDGGLEPGQYQYLSCEESMKAYKRHPDRLIPFCGVDPRRENATKILRDLVARGGRGYGEIKLRLMLDNWDLVEMYEVCAELRLPVLVHIDVPLPYSRMWYGGDVDALERAAKRCPRTTFIGHGPGFWREITARTERDLGAYPKGKVLPGGKVPRLLEKYANVYGDLSAGSGLNALQRDPNHARKFLVKHHKKLMYGTDQFDRKHLDYLESLELDRRVFAAIAGGNAARLVPVK